MGTIDWQFIGIITGLLTLATLYIKLGIRDATGKLREQIIVLDSQLKSISTTIEKDKYTTERIRTEIYNELRISETRLQKQVEELFSLIRDIKK